MAPGRGFPDPRAHRNPQITVKKESPGPEWDSQGQLLGAILPTRLAAGRPSGPGRGGHCTYQGQQQQGAPAAWAPRHRLAPPRPRLRASPAPRGSSCPGPSGAALLHLGPARGAVPGVAGSERVAGGPPAPGWRRGARSAGGASQFPPSAPGAVTSPLGTLGGWSRPARSPSRSPPPPGSPRAESLLVTAVRTGFKVLDSGSPQSRGGKGLALWE